MVEGIDVSNIVSLYNDDVQGSYGKLIKLYYGKNGI